MDFFDHQEIALKRSRWLTMWFLFAVAVVCASMCGFAFLVCALVSIFQHGWAGNSAVGGSDLPLLPIPLWQPTLYFWTSGLTAAFVLTMSLFKLRQLKAGGRAVAKAIGARRVETTTKSLPERVWRNVVEEMAIASGTPPPETYVLPGCFGLNAFVAGHTPADAALFVSEGALMHLTRDQLQALAAHEFSHLLRGDMKLNLHLMGLVHGLFAIFLLGETLLGRPTPAGRTGPVASDADADLRRQETTPGLHLVWEIVMFVVVFVVALIGWNGAFLGRVIKGWVSREREFLADAAAVQFTRSPEALVSLFACTHAWPEAGVLNVRHPEEFSHMAFVWVLPGDPSWLTATHPPFGERILRVEQMGLRLIAIKTKLKTPAPETAESAETAAPDQPTPKPKAKPEPEPALSANTLLASAGLPIGRHLQWSADWLARLPAALQEAARHPAGAEAIVYSLLLRNAGAAGETLAKELPGQCPPPVGQALNALAARVTALNDFDAIPLLELCLPALRDITPQDHQRLTELTRRIIEADQQMDLFEFALQRMLRRHLAPHFAAATTHPARYDAGKLPEDCSTLLSILAHAGAQAADEARPAFERAETELPSCRGKLKFQPEEECSLTRLEDALGNATGAPLEIQRQILAACVTAVANDGILTAREAELLRAIADSFGCPVPPLVPEAAAA